MKRLQIMIEADLDEALEKEARTQGVSKAALIRRCVRATLRPARPVSADPLWQMAGVDEFEPANVDDVVYG